MAFSWTTSIIGTVVTVIILVLSSYPLIKINSLSLPFQPVLPALNIILALAALAILWLPLQKVSFLQGQNQHRYFTVFLIVLAFIIQIIPVVLAAWAWSHVFPARFRTCVAEGQWSLWFRNKDEAVIRGIQGALECCGFNSVRDRAWPFPSHDYDAHACERLSGVTRACGPLWEQELLRVANLSAAGSIMTELLLVYVIYYLVKFWNAAVYPSFGIQRQQEDGTDTRGRGRLVGYVDHVVDETLREERRRAAAREREPLRTSEPV